MDNSSIEHKHPPLGVGERFFEATSRIDDLRFMLLEQKLGTDTLLARADRIHTDDRMLGQYTDILDENYYLELENIIAGLGQDGTPDYTLEDEQYHKAAAEIEDIIVDAFGSAIAPFGLDNTDEIKTNRLSLTTKYNDQEPLYVDIQARGPEMTTDAYYLEMSLDFHDSPARTYVKDVLSEDEYRDFCEGMDETIEQMMKQLETSVIPALERALVTQSNAEAAN